MHTQPHLGRLQTLACKHLAHAKTKRWKSNKNTDTHTMLNTFHTCLYLICISFEKCCSKRITHESCEQCVCVCLFFKLKNKNHKIKQEASKSQPRHKLFRSFFQHSSSTSRAHCFSLIGWNYSRVVVFMRCALLPHRPSLPDPDDMARRNAVTSTTSWSGSWRNVTNSRTAVWGRCGLKWSLRYSTNFEFF